MQIRMLMIALMAVAVLARTALAAPPKSIHLEAESGRLVGISVAASRSGYSGTGYVTGFQHDGDRLELTVSAKAGIYDVTIRYCSPSGDKGYDLVVNTTKFSGMFAHTGNVFSTHSAGKVELKQGINTLAIEKGWGYFDIDCIDLSPATIDTKLKRLPALPVDPKATAGARALMRALVGLYGTKTLSGQFEQEDADYIRQVTGEQPAILGDDFMDYSPSRIPYDGMPKDGTEQMIQAAKAGQIVTMVWHWNAPKDLLDKEFKAEHGQTVDARWYKGFYTYATTFDVRHALDNPDKEEYRLILRDIDAIAIQLKKFADANVPVLWRPLHEAEGGWFWWGAKGPEPFIKLWRLMYDRLTHIHGLHNLIWVYTSGGKPEWYPGDAYVDIIGIDSYPSDPGDPLDSDWEAMKARFDGKKLLAITEFGGVPDIEKMRRYGERWAYFVSWTGDLGPKKLSKEDLTRIYHSPAVVTKSELKPGY